jgi:ACS family pantothenate transporter-like MFS transporter
MWNNVLNAFWPLLFYPATDAPRFTRGMIAMICVSVATLGVTWLVWWGEKREWRKRSSVGVGVESEKGSAESDILERRSNRSEKHIGIEERRNLEKS